MSKSTHTGLNGITSDQSKNNVEKKSDPLEKISTEKSHKEVQLKKISVKTLNPQQIRWFYQSSQTENWTPFNGRDSLLIELKWRIHNNEPLGDDFPGKNDVLNLIKQPFAVLDDLYELILTTEKPFIKTIYWEDKSLELMRGTWFSEVDCYPVPWKTADEIERQHQKIYSNGQETLNKQDLYKIEHEDYDIEWKSVDTIIMRTTRMKRSWMMKLRLQSDTVKLRRTYQEEALFSDGPLSISHLILAVHGIGHVRDAKKIITNTDEVRHSADRLVKSYFPTDKKYRPMFLPIDWRTCLNLDEDTFNAIRIQKLLIIRNLFHTHALDVLYYCSPKYRSEVSEGMVMVLNKTYNLFVQFNPHFDGEISIFGHSFGSVICYDVITGWSPLQQYDEFINDRLKCAIESPLVTSETKERLVKLHKIRELFEKMEGGGLLNLLSLTDVTTMQLSFNVKHLFCIGSPLAVFLGLRGQVGADVFTKAPVLYNIFHCNDPVACRLEPLVHPLYAKVKPLKIQHHQTKNPLPYAKLPLKLIGLSPTSSADKDDLLSKIPVEKRLAYRLDYDLKEHRFEFNNYLHAFRSHNDYWVNNDVIMFVLTHIFGQ